MLIPKRLVVASAAIAAMLLFVSGALGTTGAVTTTTDTTDHFNACVHGSTVNCNAYVGKADVFLSGIQNIGAGTYFFAVVDPGNSDANDGGIGNLSSPHDSYTARTFSVDASGNVTNLGTHFTSSSGGNIQIGPSFDDTSNNGGVYILNVCEIDQLSTYDSTTHTYDPDLDPVSNCKNDAFKVGASAPCTSNCSGVASDLTASKNAIPTFARSFTWSIAKAVDKTSITQTNGSPTATFNYTVTVSPASATDGSWVVTGDITAANPNPSGDDVSGVTVTDAIDGEGNICVVSNGSTDGNPPLTVDPTNATIPGGGSIIFPYTCTYSAAPVATSETNTATVSWPTQFLSDESALVGNSTTGTASIDWTSATPTLKDDCIDVTDTLYAGTLSSGACTDLLSHLLGTGTLGTGVTGVLNPVSGPPFTSLDLKYSHTVTSPALGTCTQVSNTATFTTNDTSTTGNAGPVTVTVCNYNAALTIGYWANHLAPNGTTGCIKLPNGTGCSSNGPWTRQVLPQPLGSYYTVSTFQQAAAVFAANNCSNATKSAQNAVACLAAQLLAAELNVANIANPCINPTIASANAFLTSSVHYVGPTSTYSLSSSQRTQALALQSVLVNYNQTGSC